MGNFWGEDNERPGADEHKDISITIHHPRHDAAEKVQEAIDVLTEYANALAFDVDRGFDLTGWKARVLLETTMDRQLLESAHRSLKREVRHISNADRQKFIDWLLYDGPAPYIEAGGDHLEGGE
jgi:hypothetical protein